MGSTIGMQKKKSPPASVSGAESEGSISIGSVQNQEKVVSSQPQSKRNSQISSRTARQTNGILSRLTRRSVAPSNASLAAANDVKLNNKAQQMFEELKSLHVESSTAGKKWNQAGNVLKAKPQLMVSINITKRYYSLLNKSVFVRSDACGLTNRHR